jgi:hypothetical protein
MKNAAADFSGAPAAGCRSSERTAQDQYPRKSTMHGDRHPIARPMRHHAIDAMRPRNFVSCAAKFVALSDISISSIVRLFWRERSGGERCPAREINSGGPERVPPGAKAAGRQRQANVWVVKAWWAHDFPGDR